VLRLPAVPDLTLAAAIKLKDRLSLRLPFGIISWPKSCKIGCGCPKVSAMRSARLGVATFLGGLAAPPKQFAMLQVANEIAHSLKRNLYENVGTLSHATGQGTASQVSAPSPAPFVVDHDSERHSKLRMPGLGLVRRWGEAPRRHRGPRLEARSGSRSCLKPSSAKSALSCGARDA
jgi:hypothetical protein